MKTTNCLKNLMLAARFSGLSGQPKLRSWVSPLQLAMVLALLGGGNVAVAQSSYTWNGGSGSTGNWSDSANWGGSGPTSPQGFLNFNGAARTSSTNDFSSAGPGYQIYFKNGASAFTLYGSLVVFYDFGGGVNDPNIQNEGTSPTQTVNFPIANGNNNGTFHILNINVNTGTSQGPLTFNGAVSSADAVQAVRVINLYGPSAITFNGVISDFDSTHKLALSQLGSGTTTLTASNTFTGDMTVNAGTLVLATNSALANSTNFVRLGDTAATGIGAALNLNSGNTLSTSINVRSGSTGTKTIANTLGTTGNATFLGNLFLDADVTAFANANGTNVFSGATLDLKNQTLTVDGTGNTTISGTLTNSTGSGKLVKNSTGVLTLSGNNSYAGGTTLNTGGTININGTNAIGTGAFTIGGSSTFFDNTSGAAISNANNNALTISGGSPTFTGTKDLNFGTGIVTVSGANRTLTVNASTLTFGGGVTDSSGARKLTKAGGGTLVLNGVAGIWTGGSSLDAGTLVVGTDTTLGTGNLALNGGTLVATNGARSLGNPVTLTTSSTIGGTTALTFSSSSGLTNSGGSRTLTVNNTAATTLAGPVYLSDDNTTSGRTVTLLGSGNTTISGVIANNNVGNTVAANIIFSNTATTTISGANTYSGTTTINAGIVQVNNGGAFGTGNVTANTSPSQTKILFNGVILTNTMTLSSTNPGSSSGVIQEVDNTSSTNSGVVTYNVNTISGGNLYGPTTSGLLTMAGAINLVNPATTLVVRDGYVRFSGGGSYTNIDIRNKISSLGANNGLSTTAVVDIGGNGSTTVATILDLNGFNQTLAGVKNSVNATFIAWVTNSASASQSTLTFSNSGLQVFNGSIVGNLAVIVAGGTQVYSNSAVAGNGVFAYSGATTISAGTLTIGGAAQLGGGIFAGLITNNSILVFNSSAKQTNSGVISGTGTLTQSGTGALTLSAANTYSGATTISAGELIGSTAGSCSNSAVTVATGGTNGVLLAAANGQWACPTLTYSSGTTYADFNFNGLAPSTTTAPILVNGNLACTVTPNVIIRSANAIAPGTYPLIKYTGTLSGTPPSTVFSMPVGMTATIVNNTGNKSIDLNVTVGNLVTWAVGNAAWDINTTASWKNTSGSAVNYLDTEAVLFDDTASGATPITVSLGVTVTPASITANLTNKSYTISPTAPAGVFIGSGALVKNGGGTLTVATTNSSYTGAITVNGGTLSLANAASLGTGTLTLGNGTTFTMGSGGTTFPANPIFIPAGANVSISGNGALGDSMSGTVTSGDNASILNVISTFSFSATTRQLDPFPGTVTINSSQTLRFSANSSGNSYGGTNTTFNVNGTLQPRNAGNTIVIGALTGSGSVGPNQSASVGNSTYIVGTNNASTPFSGKFVDFGPTSATNLAIVTKVGTGTFTVSGNSAHSGATTVNVGSLMGVTGGSFSNSAVTVNIGATNGVSVTTPGNQWACTNLTYTTAGTEYALFAFGANTPSTTVAPLFVQNNITISGTLNILITGGSTTIPVGTYPLIKYVNTLSGTPPTVPLSLPQYVQGIITNDTVNKVIALIVTNVITPTLVWSAGTGTWETNSLNWTNTFAGALTNWADGNQALFDDTASGAGPFTVTLNTNVNPLNVLFTNITKNYTLAGAGSVIGSGGFTKAGAGTLVLATTNSFSGGTTVSGGTLQGSSATLLGNIANNAALVFDQTFNGSNSAVIGGTGSLTKQNSGSVTLGGNNNYTGKTLVSAGTLAISAGASVGGNPGSATTNQLTINGGTLLATNGAATITLPVNAGITVGNSGATIDVASGITLDYPAQAVSGTGTLVKNGVGVFQIDEGVVGSTYTNLTLNAGTIAFNKSSGGLGAGSITINGGIIRTTGSSSRTPDNSAILVNADFTLGSLTTAAISFANGGAWTLANGTRTITVDTITATITGVVGDGGNNYGLTKAGSGTLLLNNADIYTGPTTVNVGALKLGNNLAAGTNAITVASVLQIASGITVANAFTTSSTFESMDVPDASASGTYIGTATAVGGSANFRFMASGSGATLIFSNATVNTGSKNLWPTRGNIVYAGSSAMSSTVASIIGRSAGNPASLLMKNTATGNFSAGFRLGDSGAINSSVALTMQDSASLTTGTSGFDFLGTTVASSSVSLNGGTLAVGAFFKTAANAETLSLNGGTIKANAASAIFFPSLTGLTANVSTNGALFNDNGFNITIAQALSHDATLGATADGGLTKSGAGVTTLSGTETYSGATLVNGGTLLVSGVLGTNLVTVATNATLSGNGTINGATTVQLGGTVQPGLGGLDTATFAISNSLTLAGNAILTLDRTNAQTAAKISGITTVTYGGTLIATNVGPALQVGDTFTLFQAATYSSSFTTFVLPSLGAGLTWNTSQLAINGSISIAGLPAVTVTPATTNFVYGNSAVLTASATGASPLAYQWYNNSTNLISGATNSTLTLTVPSVSASGNYTIVVTNAYGSASNFAAVTVIPAPLGITASNVSKTYGQTVAFAGTEFSTSGLLFGDAATSVTLTSPGAINTAPVSGYAIAPSAAVGSGLANYTITYTNGTLTVNPLAVGILGTRAYDGTTNAPYSTLSVTNFVGSDSVIVASGLGGLAGATVGSQAITSFGSLALGGASATNYTLTGASGVVVITNAYAGGAMTSSANPDGYRDSVKFTNTLPIDATGYVLFKASNVLFSSNILSGGIASSLTSTNLPRGTNLITAIYSGDGNYLSSTNSLNQVVTNHAPVASGNTYARNNLPSWKIAISDLLTNASDVDSDLLSLAAVSNSTNGVTLNTNSFPGYVVYYNTNILADQFTYFVTDGYGGTNSAVITLNASSPGSSTGQVASITVTGGVASMTFLGIPGFTYNVQRATNDVSGPWFTIWTTNAPTNGAFQFNDTGATSASAYYRLSW